MQQAATHLMRAYARQPVTFARGSARACGTSRVEYLDAIAGVAVTSLGHGHPEIAAAIAEQAALLMHTSNVFRVEWQERLGQRLCALAGMEKAFFCNSGAEANEAALAGAPARPPPPGGAAADRGDGERLSWPHAGDPVGHRHRPSSRASSPCCRDSAGAV